MHAYTVNRGGQNFGAGGVITGGGNSFTFIQSNSDSHTLTVSTSTDVVADSGYDTYTLNMLGTETYGSEGTVSSGSDSFTWAQTASDLLAMTENANGPTLGAYTEYNVDVVDQMYENYSDVGNDILGASDSILGGCDTYTWGEDRDLDSTITDYGDLATPILVNAYGWDYVNLGETGSSTLTTLGHVYATNTYAYGESSGSDSGVTQTISVSPGNGTVKGGAASDIYNDSDSGTITISDTTTTSHDSFTLGDNHSISGVLTSSQSNSTSSETYVDNGSDVEAMSAQGTKSTSGDSYVFTDTESSTDNFVLNKVVLNAMNGSGTDSTSMTTSMSGFTGPGGILVHVVVAEHQPDQ